jgi:hypothetical protein
MKKSSVEVHCGRLGYQGHTKHPVTLERVLEHLLVTRLKNVKRQERVREKHGAWEWHDWDFVWQRN